MFADTQDPILIFLMLVGPWSDALDLNSATPSYTSIVELQVQPTL